MLKKFYFTFGHADYPYEGGWVEIHAECMDDAIEAFRTRYGLNEHGSNRYAGCYSETMFEQTKMQQSGNFGSYCHEILKGDKS